MGGGGLRLIRDTRRVNNETSSKERKESEEEYERNLRGERESRKRNGGRRVIGRKEDMMEGKRGLEEERWKKGNWKEGGHDERGEKTGEEKNGGEKGEERIG